MKETTNSEYQKSINKVADYINVHIYDVPTTGELAGIANISNFYLLLIFKSIIEEDMKEYINRVRPFKKSVKY